MYVRRKVYSYSDPSEQLYSVTMTGEELSLFSDYMDELNYALFSREGQEEGRDLGTLVGGAAGLGAGALGAYGADKYYKNLGRKSLKERNVSKREFEMLKKTIAADKADAIANYKNATAERKAVLLGKKSESEYLNAISKKFDKQLANSEKKLSSMTKKAKKDLDLMREYKKLPKSAKIAGAVGLAGLGLSAGAGLGRPVGGVIGTDHSF